MAQAVRSGLQQLPNEGEAMDKKRFIAAALTIALASGCASQGASDATYVYGGDGSSGASGAPDTATTYFSSPAHDTDGFAETLIGGLADLAVAKLAAPTFHSHARSDAPLHLRVNPAVTQVQRPAP